MYKGPRNDKHQKLKGHTMLDIFWSSRARKLSSMAGLIAAICGVIVGIGPATSKLADLQPIALKTYVLDSIQQKTDPMLQTESKLLIAQAQTTQTLNQIYLSQLQSSLYSAQQDEQKAPSHTVEQRIEELQQQIKALQTNTGGSR
jgi:hypothetical protein